MKFDTTRETIPWPRFRRPPAGIPRSCSCEPARRERRDAHCGSPWPARSATDRRTLGPCTTFLQSTPTRRKRRCADRSPPLSPEQ